MLKGTWLEPLVWWALLAGFATALLLVAYAIVQQDYRESLNDPQIQMAEDAAARLEAGAVPADIVPHGTPLISVRDSLAPWLAVYDANGQVLESSGELDGAPPRLPAGVFDPAAWHALIIGHHLNNSPVGQDRFTWQPEPGVRQAVVLVATGDQKYFVAAGRNMREVEQRIEHEGELVFAGWLATLAALFAGCYVARFLLRR